MSRMASVGGGVLAAALAVGLAGPAMACGQQAAAAGPARIVLAQVQTPATDSPARPARGPQSQTSVNHDAPAATATHVTGSTAQGAKVKQMNEAEKDKVNAGGK